MAVNDDLDRLVLEFAGKRIEGGWDRLRRYCGLPWSGGASETWAYRYYDDIHTYPNKLVSEDVLASSALHPGISRADLAYFWDHKGELIEWIRTHFAPDAVLRDATDDTLSELGTLAELGPQAPTLSLLTKVLHKKRPGLIPLVDREILDLYRPITGQRSATAAWPALLSALRQDLGGQNALLLAMMNTQFEKELGRSVSHVRLADIIIWMGSRTP